MCHINTQSQPAVADDLADMFTRRQIVGDVDAVDPDGCALDDS